MTLDMLKVGPRVAGLGRAMGARAARHPGLVARARQVLHDQADRWEMLAGVAASASVRLATPLERLDARAAAGPPPRDHRVIATDGSQIEPDRHGIADYYLLNIGWADVTYGSRPAAALDSEPGLYFERDELFIIQGRRRVPIREQLLSAKRARQELGKAADLAIQAAGGTAAGELPTVVLADGTLLLWVLEERPDDFLRGELLAPYVDEMLRIRDLELPLASYISRPRSTQVSGLLLEATCGGDVQGCGGCTERGDDLCPLDGLYDRELFSDLRPGERSARFSMTLKDDLAAYYRGEVPQFFYLNVGSELARVELPPWTGDDPAALELVQAVVLDQCRKGLGYPAVLARAHERAIVSMGDRLAFQYLLDGILARQGLPARPSEKQRSKRVRAV